MSDSAAIDPENSASNPHAAFAFTGGAHADVGVLCVHGFTGSPAEMRPLGEYLARRGYTVHSVLLPGHGRAAEDLKGHKWTQWTEAAHSALQSLGRTCAQVFVAGESMGGLIALHLATRYPDEVRGVISLATPSAIKDARAKLVRFARYFVPYYYPLKQADFSSPAVRESVAKRMRESLDLDDPIVVRQIKSSVRIPLDAIAELMALNEQVVKELPKFTRPVLFLQGRKDTTIAPNSMNLLCSLAGSKDKQMMWLENSGHVLPWEPDAHIVFYMAEQFIKRVVSA